MAAAALVLALAAAGLGAEAHAEPELSRATLDGTGVLRVTFSETIDASEIDPAKFHVWESGLATEGVTLSASELATGTDSATVTFVLTEANLATVRGLAEPELVIDPSAVENLSGDGFGATFDASTARPTDLFSVASQDDAPTGVAFSADGAKMFIAGYNSAKIHEYALGTPWNVYPATHADTDSFSVSSEDLEPTGVAFSSDGAKMFVVGDQNNSVYEYALGTPWDVSTANHTDSFSVASRDNTPTGVAFSADGAKMFVVGDQNNSVYEYALGTPWDVSTASHTDSFSVASQNNTPTGVAFSPDGAKMFVVGDQNNGVYEYALSTPWDASTATHTDSVLIGAWDANPQGLAFSPDGTRMFMVGSQRDSVHEYELGSAFPITILPPEFASAGLDSATGVLKVTFDEIIDGDGVDSAKFHVRESGNATGGVTLSADELVTGADSATVTFALNAANLATVQALTVPELVIDPAAVGNLLGAEFEGTFDVSTATHTDSFSVGSQDDTPTGVDFSADGAKMFIAGYASEKIYEYALSTPWDASAASHTDGDSFSVSDEDTEPEDVAFSADGAKMFVVGDQNDKIYEYALGTPWDVSTANHTDSFSVGSEDNTPNGVAFSPDGTKMFIAGFDSEEIHEYALSTPWDVTTANPTGSFSVSGEDHSPTGVAFSPDGARMFVVGNQNDNVYEYSLRTPWDVTTANPTGSFSVGDEEELPVGLAFSPDGTKMFVVGDHSNSVHEYALSSAFPITIMPPEFASATLDRLGVLDITFNEIINASEIDPAKFHVREEGAYTGGVTLSADELVTDTDSATVTFALTAANLAAVEAMTTPELNIDPAAVGNMLGAEFEGTFDVSTATYTGSFDVSGEDSVPDDVTFSPDGTKMFIAGSNSEEVYGYDLSTPWDVSTAAYTDSSFSVSSQDSEPYGLAFSPDGAKMFIAGWSLEKIFEYDLSTPWDVTTATHADGDSFSVSSEDTLPTGLAFSPDGTRMFVAGDQSDSVYGYDLSTPWDVTTATHADGDSFSVSSLDIEPTGLAFSPDGTRMFVAGDHTDSVYGYDLSTPWDVTAASHAGSVSVGTRDDRPRGLAFSPDGARMFVAGDQHDSVHEYALHSAFPITLPTPEFSSAVLDGMGVLDVTFNEIINASEIDPAKFHVREEGVYTGGVTLSADELVTGTDSATVTFALTADNLAAVEALTIPELVIDPAAVRNLLGGEFAGALDVSTATHTYLLSVSFQDVIPAGLAFSSDGTKMFVAGDNTDSVYEYALSTPWDASTATYTAGDSFSVAFQDSDLVGLAFSSDGTRMFVTGLDNDSVYEYALSTPWDASTAGYTDSFSDAARDNIPTDLAFSADGAKMFVLGNQHDSIYEYALSVPWDASTAAHTASFQVSSEDHSPNGLAFSPDGTRMFVAGSQNDNVYEYSLEAPWDVSTAAYSDSFSIHIYSEPRGLAFSPDGTKMFMVLGASISVHEYALHSAFPIALPTPEFSSAVFDRLGVLDVTFNEMINASEIDPAKFHVREAGTATGGVTLSADELAIGTDSATVTFALTADNLAAVEALTIPELVIDPAAVRNLLGGEFAGTFDVSTARYTDSFDVGDEAADPYGFDFSPDGTKMFIAGYDSEVIYGYDLTTPWDVSTATHTVTGSVQVSSEDVAFSPDGAKMFVVDQDTDSVSEYDLSTPWDVSTANRTDSVSVASEDSIPVGVAFSADGAKMFVLGYDNDEVYEYGLSTPWDVSTAAYSDSSFSVATYDTDPYGLAFSPDGAKMFVTEDNTESVYEYALATPWDVSTARFTDSFSVGSQDTEPEDVAFSPDGTRMFVLGDTYEEVYEYALSSAFPIALPTPEFSYATLDGSGALRVTFGETIDASEVDPAKFHVREAGTRTGGVTLSASELATHADSATVTFVLTATHLATVQGMAVPELAIDPAAVSNLLGGKFGGTFDVSTARYTDSFSVSDEDDFPTGMAFSSDGAKMFVVGQQYESVYEYALGTPWDASTASHTDSFSVASEDTLPTGVAFSSDGAKMFVVGFQNESVHEYALSVPWDASTANPTDSFSVSSRDGSPTDLAFSSDGAKMFVVGADTDSVLEYDLSVPWDASTAGFTDSFSVYSHDNTPNGLAFSSDGARMFVVGTSSDKVHEYALSSAFPITVLPPRFSSATLDSSGALRVTFSEPIDASGVDPAKFHVRESGTYTGGITLSADELATDTDSATLTFALNASNLESVEALATPELTLDPAAVSNLLGGEFVGTFDVSTARYTDSFDVGDEDESPYGVAFSSDGAKMFISGLDSDEIYEYALQTAWDASTASHTDSFSVGGEDTRPEDVAFSPDGAKMFVMDSQNKKVYEYGLDPPWNVTTAAHTDGDSVSVGGEIFSPTGLAFSSDGAKMFVAGSAGASVYEYALQTAWDVTTASHTGSFSVRDEDNGPVGVAFSPDGAKMFVVGSVHDRVHEYGLSTPWDVTTASHTDSFSVGGEDTRPEDVAFSPDGAKMFVVGDQHDSVYEYALHSAFPITVLPPKFVSATLDRLEVLEVTFNEIINASEIAPAKFYIREAGVATGGIALSADELATDTDSATVTFNLTAANLAVVEALVTPELNIDPAAVSNLLGAGFVGTFDVSTARYTDSFSVSDEDVAPAGVAFSPDGAKMFIAGWFTEKVYEYALSVPWDASTANPTDSFWVGGEDDSLQGLAFSPDGAKMFVAGAENANVYEYALSVPWDASTASHMDGDSISVVDEDNGPYGVAFSPDGAKMFVAGVQNDSVYEYALGTPWDASTANHTDSFSVGDEDDGPNGLAFSPDGAKMFVAGAGTDSVYEYALSVPWDASTANHTDSFSVSSQDGFLTGVAFSPDGAKMFVTGVDNAKVYEYALRSAFPIALTAGDPFVTTWTATESDRSITFPGIGSYTIDWGDGTTEDVKGRASHKYDGAGTYTVTASGDLTRFNLGSGGQNNARQLASIEQWGHIKWESMENAFQFATNMDCNAADSPDLSRVKSTSKMFHDASTFDCDVSGWDTSNVRNMYAMFWGAASFDSDVSGWDTSKVRSMKGMFAGAAKFNQSLSGWDTSKVRDMSLMFSGAHDFDGNVSGWKTGRVTDMSAMFSGANSFDQDISGWKTGRVTSMIQMFEGADSFDQDISEWNVRKVTDMRFMFDGATSFAQDLSGWDVSKGTKTKGMFWDSGMSSMYDWHP